MRSFLEEYGKTIFTLVIIAILIAFASPIGTKIKTATTEKINQTNAIADDEAYVTRTGRPKPPKEAVDQVYCIYYTDGELVISQNQIEPESGRTVEKQGFYTKPSACTKNMTTARFEGAVMPKSCYQWFYHCKNLTQIKNMQNLYTNECTDMSCMFSGSNKLATLDMSGFATNKVIDMSYMFQNCANINILDIRNFDTSNVKYMCGMFQDMGPKIVWISDKWIITQANINNMYKFSSTKLELHNEK